MDGSFGAWLVHSRSSRPGADSVQLRTIEEPDLRFNIQLEILRGEGWLGVARYDNAHGFCHRDTLHPDGSPDKTGVFVGDLNETFTFAIEDLRANYPAQRS